MLPVSPEKTASYHLKRELYFAAITAVVLFIFASLLTAGYFTPGISYHISAYMAAGCYILALLPLAITTCLCTKSSSPRIIQEA